MSDTITDMAKVTQMLDAGWSVCIWKNELGSYTAEAEHERTFIVRRVQQKLIDSAPEGSKQFVRDTFDDDSTIDTDDFTPEQALTRLAYKVHGEIL